MPYRTPCRVTLDLINYQNSLVDDIEDETYEPDCDTESEVNSDEIASATNEAKDHL